MSAEERQAGDAPASPFAVPVYRAIWSANLLSQFGGLIQSVGAAWLMTELTRSPGMVALVQSSVTLPLMLFSLVAGALADNFDRRRVMLVAQIFMFALSALLAGLAYAGLLTPWLLLGFTFLIGVGVTLNAPAWQATVGEIVPRPLLPRAVAYNSMGFNLARSLGPAFGGLLVAAAGAFAAFLVNAISYAGIITVLLRWKRPETPRTLPPEPVGEAMAAGLRYVIMSPDVLRVLFRAFLFGLTASALSALMPLIARDLLGGGANVFGLLMGAFGVGAVSGALVVGRLRQRLSSEGLVRWATLALAAGTALAGATGFLPLTLVAAMLAGGGWVLALSTFNVTVQMAVPRWVVGRALALYQTAAFGAMAAGSWLFGELAGATSLQLALFIAGALQALLLAAAWRFPMPAVADLDLDPLARWQEPDVAVPVDRMAGPLLISIEYRIAADNVPAFLEAMRDRRRIRIRDGARDWRLLRDLGDPALWIERYEVATWIDYVRHHARRTRAVAPSAERVMALHEGPERPRVRRELAGRPGLPAAVPPLGGSDSTTAGL